MNSAAVSSTGWLTWKLMPREERKWRAHVCTHVHPSLRHTLITSKCWLGFTSRLDPETGWRNQRSSGTLTPPAGWSRCCRTTGRESDHECSNDNGLMCYMRASSEIHQLPACPSSPLPCVHVQPCQLSRHHAYAGDAVCECVCVFSLLSQVSGHIAALEAIEVIEALGQPLRSLAVDPAAVGQRVGAAALQTLQAAQITVFWVIQHICEVGVTGRERTCAQTHISRCTCLCVRHTSVERCLFSENMTGNTEVPGMKLNYERLMFTSERQTRFKWLHMIVTHFHHHLMSCSNAVNLIIILNQLPLLPLLLKSSCNLKTLNLDHLKCCNITTKPYKWLKGP